MPYPELLSVVIHLQPFRTYAGLDQPLGHKVQGWFLAMIKNSVPGFAHLLHGDTAYTVSGLQPQVAGSPGKFFIRLTSLAGPLSELMVEHLLPNLPRRLVLHPHEFDVVGATTRAEEHPWAGEDSYAGLVERGCSSGWGQACFEFASPTSFRSGPMDIPLPIPFDLFQSYLRKWNQHGSAERIPEEWLAFVKRTTLIEQLRGMEVQRWALPGNQPASGFVGQVEMGLRISKRQRQELESPALEETYRHYWRALTFYAFYCGTGQHVTSGMGQTRLAC